MSPAFVVIMLGIVLLAALGRWALAHGRWWRR